MLGVPADSLSICVPGQRTLPLSFMPWTVWEDPLREGAQFFFPSRILADDKLVKEWFAAFGGGFIFLLISSLFKYQEQFYFNPLLLTASYCNPLSYIKCNFILLLLKGWSIIRHISVTTGTTTALQGSSVSSMGAITKSCYAFTLYKDVTPYMGQWIRQRA